ETLLRISWPMSPMSDPSRANTRDDCASCTICHASPVEPAAGVCATAAEPSRERNSTSRDDRKTLLQLGMGLVHTKLDDGSGGRSGEWRGARGEGRDRTSGDASLVRRVGSPLACRHSPLPVQRAYLTSMSLVHLALVQLKPRK